LPSSVRLTDRIDPGLHSETNMKKTHLPSLMLVAMIAFPAHAQNDQIKTAISSVQAVQLNGQGNAEAVEAMKVLNTARPDQIVPMLGGISDNNPIAANWLRAAGQKAVQTSQRAARHVCWRFRFFATPTRTSLNKTLQLLPTIRRCPCERLVYSR